MKNQFDFTNEINGKSVEMVEYYCCSDALLHTLFREEGKEERKYFPYLAKFNEILGKSTKGKSRHSP